MNKKDDYFMRKAIEFAIKSKEKGNAPFGAVLVKDDNIVMIEENEVNTLSDPTSHAEMRLIRNFCQQNRITDLHEYTLYSSCEPCAMCCAAMSWANLGKLVYSVSNDELTKMFGDNIKISSKELFQKSTQKPVVVENVLNKEGLKVLEKYKF